MSTATEVLSVRSPAWMQRALCAETDPELFFSHPGEPGEPERVAAALAVCARCPVRVECLLWAFSARDQWGNLDRWGILGGRTPAQRDRILGGRTDRMRHLRDEIMARVLVWGFLLREAGMGNPRVSDQRPGGSSFIILCCVW